MAEEKDELFDQIMSADTKSDEIDDLLSNPFDLESKSEKENVQQFQSELADAAILAKRKLATEKIIDRLPEHRQLQAKKLASQIDEKNLSGVISYGAKAQRRDENLMVNCTGKMYFLQV